MRSKIGFALSGVYTCVALYLMVTQGLFGESFIALILGMPWTLVLAAIEFGGAEDTLAAILLLIPIALNAVILYYIGARIEKWRNQRTP